MSKKLVNLNKSKKNVATLTEHNQIEQPAIELTRHKALPFSICFKHKLDSKYNLAKLEKANLKKFQSFLDKVSSLSFSDVDEKYLKITDRQDKFGEFQIIHYELSKAFRLHGYISLAMFHVVRIDPNHNFHK